jgi:hypothetical protein
MSLITEAWLFDVCKVGQSGTCRYAMTTYRGYECAKLSGFAAIIDQGVLNGTIAAVGDNCPGIMMSRPISPLLTQQNQPPGT